jgi:hypothetical protein
VQQPQQAQNPHQMVASPVASPLVSPREDQSLLEPQEHMPLLENDIQVTTQVSPPKITSVEEHAKTLLEVMPKTRPKTRNLGLPQVFICFLNNFVEISNSPFFYRLFSLLKLMIEP